jgi:putative sterol carrier protein
LTADVTIVATVQTALALMSGAVSPLAALETGRIEVTGDRMPLGEFPQLFDVATKTPRSGS